MTKTLQSLPITEVLFEVERRLRSDDVWCRQQSAIHGAGVVVDLLQAKLRSLHDYRFSPVRYRDMFRSIYWSQPLRPQLEGRVCVDLGCGTWNPMALSLLLLLLGAEKCYAFDIDPVNDPGRSARGLAELAVMMLVSPRAIVEAYPIAAESILRNLRGFDLARLGAGDAAVPVDRLDYQLRDAGHLPLSDGEADLIASNAFLEHVAEPAVVIAELARVTKRGGVNVHGIDSTDHRRYEDGKRDALDYLCLEGVGNYFHLVNDSDRAIGHDMNRLRPVHYARLFEQNGFTVVDVIPWHRQEVTVQRRGQFVEPFRSMSLEDLSLVSAQFLVRRD